MVLLRKEAITLASFLKYFNLPLNERKGKIENATAELSLDDLSVEMENYYGRKYVENEMHFFSNGYFQTFLSTQLSVPVEVKGEKPKLFPCFCCGYNTLKKRGEYFICNVCYWEDNGSNELYKYSNVNRMTLNEGKENFIKLGVISKQFQNIVDHDRMIQYEKSNE